MNQKVNLFAIIGQLYVNSLILQEENAGLKKPPINTTGKENDPVGPNGPPFPEA